LIEPGYLPGTRIISMEDDQELVQLTERALADAEEELRRDPTEANRAWKAWSSVRSARERARKKEPRSTELSTPTEGD
jgi:hypothetical protein